MASNARAKTGSKTRIATKTENHNQLRPALAGCKTRFRMAARTSIRLSIVQRRRMNCTGVILLNLFGF